MNESTAKLTAKWWRKKLECSHHNNGDNSTPNIMASLMADTLAAKNTPTSSQLDKFEEVLTNIIIKKNNSCIYLDCDYGPCEELATAAREAGINSIVFPWKTLSTTEENKVEVRDGYGAPWTEVHESDFES